MIELMSHQEECAQYWVEHPRMFNHGDAGTGKTISSLEGYKRAMKGRLLVIGPLSILGPAWVADIKKYLPGFTFAVATTPATNRYKAFNSGADIVMINHDGVKWLEDNLDLLENFSHGVADEYPAFKNRSTGRSKAMRKVVNAIEYWNFLSGTPNSNKITDLWYPTFMLDGGRRLGDNFYRFQQETCEGRPIPGAPSLHAMEWVEKPGARDAVAMLLADMTIRHKLEDCVDIPENTRHMMYVDMPRDVMRAYKTLEREAVLATQNGVIDAVHAGSRARKILQLLSGAVYNGEGKVVKVHPHRYQLVIDLIAAREQCVVAFNYRHEREQLCEMADKAGFSYGVIDGSVAPSQRHELVDKFQAGELKVIFAHPQSAGHGLTLTKGTSTIWASPTYNAEHYIQFNARIYRKGQTRKTETICICANDTKEAEVYEKLDGKIQRMTDLLAIFAIQTEQEHAA